MDYAMDRGLIEKRSDKAVGRKDLILRPATPVSSVVPVA